MNIETQRPLPSLTVCIPTYHGGTSLVRAVRSVRESQNVRPFRMIVAVDGNPLQVDIAKQLREMDVEIVFNERRGGQVARIKQMVAMVDTELVVLAQDDIRLDEHALSRIAQAFADDSRLTMVGAHVVPEAAQTFFERIVEMGVHISHRAGMQWRGADNYLLASGRCLAFRAGHLAQFDIPEDVINSDAYLYYENRRRGGTFRHVTDAVVFNKSPLHMHEYLNQTHKFAYSQAELSHYFGGGLKTDFAVPGRLLLSALGLQFLRHPFYTALYCGAQAYAKLQPNRFSGAKRFWDTDASTKR